MLEAVLRYLAGFVDGEGSFVIRTNKQNGKVYYAPALQVSNSDIRPLQTLQSIFGGAITINPAHRPNRDRKVIYRWACVTRQARAAAKLLLPFLVIKQPQAAIFCQWPIGKGGNSSQLVIPNQAVYSKQKTLVTIIHKLNRYRHA